MWYFLFGVFTGFIISHYSLQIGKALKAVGRWFKSLKNKFAK